jgi:hypothetical protein
VPQAVQEVARDSIILVYWSLRVTVCMHFLLLETVAVLLKSMALLLTILALPVSWTCQRTREVVTLQLGVNNVASLNSTFNFAICVSVPHSSVRCP